MGESREFIGSIKGPFWDEQTFESRKRNVQDVWRDTTSTEHRKKAISLLVAHAPNEQDFS